MDEFISIWLINKLLYVFLCRDLNYEEEERKNKSKKNKLINKLFFWKPILKVPQAILDNTCVL